MTRTIGLGLLCAALCWGCGDDDGGGGGGDTDAGPMGTDTGPVSAGMCTNMSDSAAVMATYTVDMEMVTVAEIAGSCARMCALSGIPEEMQPMCITDCIDEDTMDAISDGCKSCFLMSIGCVREHCLSDCIGDPAAPDCLACQCGMNPMMVNCRDVFSDCSGIPSDACAGM